jgi:hypothetical protein
MTCFLEKAFAAQESPEPGDEDIWPLIGAASDKGSRHSATENVDAAVQYINTSAELRRPALRA